MEIQSKNNVFLSILVLNENEKWFIRALHLTGVNFGFWEGCVEGEIAAAGIVPDNLLHFLRPWRSDAAYVQDERYAAGAGRAGAALHGFVTIFPLVG